MMRNKFKWTVGTIFVLIAVLFIFLSANRSALIAGQIQRQVKKSIDAQTVPPGLFEIVFCGTGSPQYQKGRNQACTAIIAGGRLFLFDVGQGAAQSLQGVDAPFHALAAVFLTHHHSDHISGLGDVLHNSWLYGRQQQVEVIGPPGTMRIRDGFAATFEADLKERWHTVGTEYVSDETTLGAARDVSVDGSKLAQVYNQDGVIIRAFRVDHPHWDHAYGYRFEYDGKVIIISGDTRYSPNLLAHAKGADVLIHEAVNPGMMHTIADALREGGGSVDPDRMARIVKVHTPTTDLASLAQEAGVAHLIVTHLIPPIPPIGLVEAEFIRGMDEIYKGQITVARDGMRIGLGD